MDDLFAHRGSSAVISNCGTYRYRLERGDSHDCKTVAFIMVNPSTADGLQDDATIRKVKGFTQRLGYGRVIVGNLFAYRAPDIKELRTVQDPVGPHNNKHLHLIMEQADQIIVAWGPMAKLPPHLRTRYTKVVEIADHLGIRLKCLGIANDGHPRHPLMLSYATHLVDWQPSIVRALQAND